MRLRPLAALTATLIATAAAAGPLALVGDRQLRQDVETLKAAGLIVGPIDSWPLPWPQVEAGLNRATERPGLRPHIAAAVARLRALSELSAAPRAFEAQASATNSPAVARDFSSRARARFEGSARAEANLDAVSLSVGAVARSDQVGKAIAPEGTMLVLLKGNWAFHFGWTEHWFGPGIDGALLFSNSSRPFPTIGFKRLVPRPIDLPVLRWLGPVQFEIFGGVLDEKRIDYDNIVTIGTRLSFEPARGLAIALNRSQILCGKGRPCGFKQISNSFIGFGNADNVGPDDRNAFFNQAGNQLAGFDISFTRTFGAVAVKLYAEAEAEDFDNVILEQYGRLVGLTLSGPVGRDGASFSANLEYADTQAASLFNGTPLEKLTGGETVYPGSLYNNAIYFGGYAYNKRPIGYWTDGDSRNLALSLSVTDVRNRRFYATARSVHLNFNDLGDAIQALVPPPRPPVVFPRNRVSGNEEKFASVDAGVEWPTSIGDLRLEGRWRSDSPNTPGRRDSHAAIEAGWRVRF